MDDFSAIGRTIVAPSFEDLQKIRDEAGADFYPSFGADGVARIENKTSDGVKQDKELNKMLYNLSEIEWDKDHPETKPEYDKLRMEIEKALAERAQRMSE